MNDLLKYRRQFLLTSEDVNLCWHKTQVNNTLHVYNHPDLNVEVYGKDNRKIILLGYIIDSEQSISQSEILSNLINSSGNFSELCGLTYALTGRFVLIYVENQEVKILNDPCGLRSVYYSFEEDRIFIGSSPMIIADVQGKKETKNTQILEFINSPEFTLNESAWFGDKTIFDNIFHVMPNHYLDCEKQKVERYWIGKITNLNLTDVVMSVGEMLQNSIVEMSRRVPIQLAVTAGWDSRILLAASKQTKVTTKYFVSSMDILPDSHMDIKIPNLLAKNNDFEIEVIRNITEIDEEFIEILKRNVMNARVLPKTKTIYHFYRNKEKRVTINGNASEISRLFYGIVADEFVTAEYLAKLMNYEKFEFVVAEFQSWLDNTREFAKTNQIPLLDLFYWEQRMGNWGVHYPNEQDIAVDEFTPFNNRKLIIELMCIQNEYREESNNVLYKQIIESMWPELMQVPVNPLSLKQKVKGLMPSNLKMEIKKFMHRVNK